MNSSTVPHPARAQNSAPGLNLDDVLYTLFRHKWLILGFFFLGLVGVAGVCLTRPPLYVSKAKIMVDYVLDTRPVKPTDPESQNVHPIDPGVQATIAAEVDIITSADVATLTARQVGPKKILARKGGGDDPVAAAGVVSSGLEVEPPRTAVITVAFKHPDKGLVQQVLDALIQNYMRKHMQVHQKIGVLDGYYSQLVTELRQQLKQTEDELKRLKTSANLLFVDETKRSFQAQITKTQDQLLEAQRELDEHKAVLGNLASGTNSSGTVSPAVLAEYADVNADLERLKKDEREMLRMYKEAYPSVQRVKTQIEKLTRQKNELERVNPSLADFALSTTYSMGTNGPGGDVAYELAQIRKLNARVGALGQNLSNIQFQALQLLDKEPEIAEVQRRRDEQQKRYELAEASLEATAQGQSQLAGKASNISIVENPTAPSLDRKKVLKLIVAIFAGCVGAGLGLAFLLDHVLDRSIKRAVDVERHLQLPVFLTIPDSTWNAGFALPWSTRRSNGHGAAQALIEGTAGPEGATTEMALAEVQSPLDRYAEGLRERLMAYFESRNLNLKKPKLVGVTACNKGAGVSTLASGLAAELSKTGDGNVLLVDVNGEQGMAHPFYHGRPGCGLTDALEPNGRADAQVQENLFVASMDGQVPAPIPPTRFGQIVPKLKASDYDYIIFDLPPVSPLSSTPRLAGHMDLVLLVLESEATGQKAAARANALMAESHASVAAVLNKHRPHVPAQLAQEDI